MYGGQIHFLAALATLHQDTLKKGMNSSCSSYRPDAIHPILHVVKVQLILFFKSSWCKIASAARNKINSAPQAAVPTFAFSSVLILLLWNSPSSMEIRNVLSDSPVTSVGNMPSDLTFHLPDLLFKNYFVLIICLSVDTNPHCLPGGHMCPHVNFLFLCIWRVWCRRRAHVLTQIIPTGCVNLSLSNM